MLIPAEIQFLSGTAFGLTQPTAIVVVSTKIAGKVSLNNLWQQFSLFGIATPEAVVKTRNEPEKLFASLVYFAGAIQRQLKIPVSETFSVQAISSDKLILAMPYVDASATNIIVTWINQAFANFCTHQVFNSDLDAPAGKLPAKLLSGLKQFAVNGVNNYRFMRSADQLKVPVRRMIAGMYAYGTGQYTRILDSSFIDSTSAIGAKLCGDKVFTATVLRDRGLPAPVHGLASNESQALALAAKITYPVVVKPADREQGTGVHAGLVSDEEVKQAFANARRFSSRILVEKYFDGIDHRLTVYKNRVLQVVSKMPGGVVGDGVSSLSELVAASANSPENQRRIRDFGKPMLELDAEALELAGKLNLQPDSVVPQGQRVALRRKANVSAGGTPVPVPLEHVHPDNLRLAVSAAKALNLNLAGVDLLIPDITQSWLESGALICEVNAQPQISQSERPEIYADILKDLLGNTHSIPVWLCITDATDVRLQIPADNPVSSKLGYSSAAGTWIGGIRTTGKHTNGFVAAKALLSDRSIAGAIVCMTGMELIRFGLPVISCESMLIDQNLDNVAQEIIRRHAVSVKSDILIHRKYAASNLKGQALRITADNDPFGLLVGRIEQLASRVVERSV